MCAEIRLIIESFSWRRAAELFPGGRVVTGDGFRDFPSNGLSGKHDL
jgi:hypothetical protein